MTRPSDPHHIANPDTGCWDWKRYRNAQGYGEFRGPKLRRLAHIVYYENENGPVPDGLELDHVCRNRACVNPDHLEAVTHEENMRRAVAARTHFGCGHERTPENSMSNGVNQSGNPSVRCRICERARLRKRS